MNTIQLITLVITIFEWVLSGLALLVAIYAIYLVRNMMKTMDVTESDFHN